MIEWVKYKESNYEICYSYLLSYYNNHKYSSPFLPCNYVWGAILTSNEYLDKQILIYDDEIMIGLITFDGSPGEDFVFLNDEYEYLLSDAVKFCEENLTNKAGELSFRFNELNGLLKDTLINMNYELWWEDVDTYINTSDCFPEYELPDGFRLIHGDSEDFDNDKANLSTHYGFDNKEEFNVEEGIAFTKILKSTKYYDMHERVAIIDSEGNYCCNAHFWIDSDYCVLEPLSTHPDYRKKGLARYMLRYGYELARKNNCLFFRGGPMEYYAKAKMSYFKGFHFGKKGLRSIE